MNKDGFTLVELIFVIIIIGILGFAAIPKFGDIKDRAKINSEYSIFSKLDSLIVSQTEFYRNNYKDTNYLLIDWHNIGVGNYDTSLNGVGGAYRVANDNKKVLSKILKKSDNLQIIAYVDASIQASDDKDGADDILFITGEASNRNTGAIKDVDIEGKPDKNDVWVFNGSSSSATIKYFNSDNDNGTDIDTKVIESGKVDLIDLSGITPIKFIDSTDATSAGEVSIRCDVSGIMQKADIQDQDL